MVLSDILMLCRLRRKMAESLTVRIFLITFLILLSAGAVTFGLIAWATPSTYTAVVTDDLTAQVDDALRQGVNGYSARRLRALAEENEQAARRLLEEPK